LGHIVVRAESQASDLVDIVLLGGNHDDRRVLLAADLTADLESGRTRRSSWFPDRKSTRLNSSHVSISYAVFCLKKKKKSTTNLRIKDNTLSILRSNRPTTMIKQKQYELYMM